MTTIKWTSTIFRAALLSAMLAATAAHASCKDDYQDAVRQCTEDNTEPDDVESCTQQASNDYAECVGR